MSRFTNPDTILDELDKEYKRNARINAANEKKYGNAIYTIKNTSPARAARIAEEKNREEKYAKNLESTEAELEKLKSFLKPELMKCEDLEDITKAMETYSSELEAFKLLSDNYFKFKEINSLKQVPPYNKLIADLCENNLYFILYFDFSKLVDYDIASVISKLDRSARKELQIKMEKAGMFNFVSNFKSWPNAFIKNAIKYFPEYLLKLQDNDEVSIKDITTALALEPSQWNKLSEENKDILLTCNGYIEGILLNDKNAEILKYISKEDFEKHLKFLYDDKSSTIGKIILNNPNVLNYIDDSFFKKYENKLKYMFKKPKLEIAKAFQSYPQIQEFPTLCKFIGIYAQSNLDL